MMSWLTPLGFLGLIGIAILILIYILKPNYQQKFISSTFIWELSLKYKKRKIPINKFRNILLFLCQILIICSCAAILAQPIIAEAQSAMVIDRVVIIDASASMRTAYDEESRFERAVFRADEIARQTFDEEGYVTIIFAGEKADYMAQRATVDSSFDVYSDLSDLIQEDACTYGEADIQGAIELAQRIVDQNVDAEVYLCTATEYLDQGGNVIIEDCGQNGEWNAAILNCQAYLEENYYTFKVTVASYGKDANLFVYCDVKGANGVGTVKLQNSITCNADQTRTISFVTANSENKIFEFESVRVYLSENDSFERDNDFFIYGGKKPELNMLYYNPHASFFSDVMLTARTTMSDDWSVNYKEINSIKVTEIPVSGYDFCIYEGTMPDVLPTDGVVMLVNMNKAPDGLTAVLGKEITGNFQLSFGNAHPITNYMNLENFVVTKYTRLLNYEGFEPLLYCAGDPVLLVKESEGQKIVLMNFSVNFSTLIAYVEFPIMMYNILEYFLPATLTGNAFSVNESISLNARSEELSVQSTDGAYKTTFTEFPTEIKLTTPGSYTVTQTPISGIPQVEQFFVKIPSSESNIFRVEDSLYELIVAPKQNDDNLDLLLYFAAALVALVFAERLLRIQDS